MSPKKPKKPKRPPLEHEAVLARLEEARDAQHYVGIRRWIPDADRNDGYVLAVGEKWIALSTLNQFRFGGWCFLRFKDIQAVFIDRGAVETRVLQAQGGWPPSAVDAPLDDTASILHLARNNRHVISIHTEFDRPGALYCGSVTKIGTSTMDLLEVDIRGEWTNKPRTFDLDDITQIDFGGPYEEGLATVAGPPPLSPR